MFQTTQWSMIRQAGVDSEQGRAALGSLCRDYRPAMLAYLRAAGYPSQDAEDLVQGFFARFLEKRLHAAANPQRGRFRVFLRVALRNFVANEHTAANRLRRAPPGFDADNEIESFGSDDAGPERAFERAWTLTLIDRALRRLQQEADANGRGQLFEALREFLTEAPDGADYARVAAATGMRVNSVAVATHRLRQRLRELIEQEVRQTVGGGDELKLELQRLR